MDIGETHLVEGMLEIVSAESMLAVGVAVLLSVGTVRYSMGSGQDNRTFQGGTRSDLEALRQAAM